MPELRKKMKDVGIYAAGLAAKCIDRVNKLPETAHICIVLILGLIAVFTAPLGVLCGIIAVLLGAGYFFRDRRKYGWLAGILVIISFVGIFV